MRLCVSKLSFSLGAAPQSKRGGFTSSPFPSSCFHLRASQAPERKFDLKKFGFLTPFFWRGLFTFPMWATFSLSDDVLSRCSQRFLAFIYVLTRYPYRISKAHTHPLAHPVSILKTDFFR